MRLQERFRRFRPHQLRFAQKGERNTGGHTIVRRTARSVHSIQDERKHSLSNSEAFERRMLLNLHTYFFDFRDINTFKYLLLCICSFIRFRPNRTMPIEVLQEKLVEHNF